MEFDSIMVERKKLELAQEGTCVRVTDLKVRLPRVLRASVVIQVR